MSASSNTHQRTHTSSKIFPPAQRVVFRYSKILLVPWHFLFATQFIINGLSHFQPSNRPVLRRQVHRLAFEHVLPSRVWNVQNLFWRLCQFEVYVRNTELWCVGEFVLRRQIQLHRGDVSAAGRDAPQPRRGVDVNLKTRVWPGMTTTSLCGVGTFIKARDTKKRGAERTPSRKKAAVLRAVHADNRGPGRRGRSADVFAGSQSICRSRTGCTAPYEPHPVSASINNV